MTLPTQPPGRPFTTFNFLVEISVEDEQIGPVGFSECDGLEMTMEPKTIREGGRNEGPVHLTGPVTYGQLTLKRGMTSDARLWKWFEDVVADEGRGKRAEIDVIMQDSAGPATGADERAEAAVFHLTGCLPVKVRAPMLSALDGLAAIEELAVAFETMKRRPDAAATPATGGA